MIVLDTNVLSEAMRPSPDTSVIAWLSGPESRDAHITAITVGEILSGVGMLQAGRRREQLRQIVERQLDDLSDRILAYDARAARIFASLRADRRDAGRPLSVEDGMIAAICARENAPLATRNVRDFADLGVALIDPWRQPSA